MLTTEWGEYRDDVREYSLPEDLPADFALAFRTADGARGKLRLTEFLDDPRRVKIRYSLVNKSKEGTPKKESDAIFYSATEYIVTAEPAPGKIGDKDTLRVFNLGKSHQSGWHVRGNKFKDLLKTTLMYSGDIYYYYDEQGDCGKAVFLRQEAWSREGDQSLPDIPVSVVELKNLPLEVSVATIDGREYQVRFSDPKASRTGTMVGALRGNPADLRKQCLIRTYCSNDGSFTLRPFDGNEFDAVADQILTNPQYRVFEGLFCAVYDGVDEIMAHCRYSDAVSQYAFGDAKLTKSLTLKRVEENKWQIVKGILERGAPQPCCEKHLLEKNPASKMKLFPSSQNSGKAALDSDSVTVDLLGIAIEPVGSNGWWDAQGRAITNVFWEGSSFQNDDGFETRQLVFCLNSPDCDPEMKPKASLQFIRKTMPVGARSGVFFVEANGKTAEDLIGATCSLHGDDDSLDVELTVHYGAWKTLTEFEPEQDQAGVITRTAEAEVVLSDPVEKDGKTKLMVTVFGHLDVYRLIAVDDRGIEHESSEQRASTVAFDRRGNQNQVIKGTFTMPLKSIKSFHLQIRPFKKVEFRDLPVHQKPSKIG